MIFILTIKLHYWFLFAFINWHIEYFLCKHGVFDRIRRILDQRALYKLQKSLLSWHTKSEWPFRSINYIQSKIKRSFYDLNYPTFSHSMVTLNEFFYSALISSNYKLLLALISRTKNSFPTTYIARRLSGKSHLVKASFFKIRMLLWMA